MIDTKAANSVHHRVKCSLHCWSFTVHYFCTRPLLQHRSIHYVNGYNGAQVHWLKSKALCSLYIWRESFIVQNWADLRKIRIFIWYIISITDAAPESCQRLQELDSLLPDDYYWITMVAPEDRTTIGSAIIYCHDMASAAPREFIPLPTGGIYNYASMSKIKGSHAWMCYSDRIFSGHGYTEFRMVRVALANKSQASSYACSWSYDQTKVPSPSERLILYKAFHSGRNLFVCGCYSTSIAYNVYHHYTKSWVAIEPLCLVPCVR